MRKMGHLSSYHVYYWGVMVKCQKWLIFVFTADGSKKLVTIWAKYLNASERSHLALSENAIIYCILSHH